MFLQFLTELKNCFKNITPSVPPHGKLTSKKVSAKQKLIFRFNCFTCAPELSCTLRTRLQSTQDGVCVQSVSTTTVLHQVYI